MVNDIECETTSKRPLLGSEIISIHVINGVVQYEYINCLNALLTS